jgi:hypothetical protein
LRAVSAFSDPVSCTSFAAASWLYLATA